MRFSNGKAHVCYQQLDKLKHLPGLKRTVKIVKIAHTLFMLGTNVVYLHVDANVFTYFNGWVQLNQITEYFTSESESLRRNSRRKKAPIVSTTAVQNAWV